MHAIVRLARSGMLLALAFVVCGCGSAVGRQVAGEEVHGRAIAAAARPDPVLCAACAGHNRRYAVPIGASEPFAE